MASNSGASNGFDGKAASSWATHPRGRMRSHEPIVFDAVGNLSLREVEGPVASPPGRTLPAPTREEGPVAEAAPASRRRKTPIDGSGATNGATGQSVTATGPGARRAADRPGGRRPEPSLRIIDTRILRGPNYWAREPVVRMVVDLGVLEEFPSNKIPGFVDALVEHAAQPRGPRLQPGPPRRLHHAARAKGRGSVTSRSTSPSSSRTSPAPTSATARRAAPASTAGTTCIYEYREEQVGIEAGKMAVGLVNHLVAPNDERSPSTSWPSSSASSASRSASPSGHRRRPSSTRRPAATSRPSGSTGTQPRPAGAGGPPAADPGDHDVGHERHRRRHRERQEADQPAARFGRPAGPPQRGRRDRGRRRRRGEAPRLPVCREAARRQSRPGRRPRSQGRGRRPGRVPGGPAPEPQSRRRRRELHHRQRLSLPDHRRHPRRRRRARPGRRHRRRREHDPPAGRPDQRRPAPRHRPREGAHEDQARRRGRSSWSRHRASASTTSRPTAGA